MALEKELILSDGLGFDNNLSSELLTSFGNISGKDGEMLYADGGGNGYNIRKIHYFRKLRTFGST